MNDLKVSGDVSGIMGPGPVPTANSRPHGTILFDAVYLAAADKLKSEVGRKAIVLITDGQDQGSRYKSSRRSKPPSVQTRSSIPSSTSTTSSLSGLYDASVHQRFRPEEACRTKLAAGSCA